MRKALVRTRSRGENSSPATPAPTDTSLLGLASEDIVKAPFDRKPQLRVDYLPITQLRESNRKLRRYGKRHLTALKASLDEFGIVRPVLIDKDGMIIAGVAIWLAAKELKHETIPVIRIEHLTPEQIRLYRIADNKLQMGEFVEDELRLEFLELSDLSIDLNLDLDVENTGFTTKEIDDITLRKAVTKSDGGGGGSASGEEDDDDVEPGPGTPVTRPGDIWLIGTHHKVSCGNSLEAETYAALMGDELAQMVVGDSPYNCPIKGNVSSRKNAKEFEFASGEMSSEEFIAFLRTVFAHLARFSIDGSIHYAFMDWRCLFELLAAGKAEYDEHRNTLIWVKTNASRGWYRSQYEACAVFK
ncbi:MAG: hypothetical protein JF604_00555, partial [Bradyrhizobium sp.]|nr:hypothetical protein [Bradyrhizobium sp.]